MKATFKVVGEIMTKQRPRAVSIGGHARVYTPKDTIMYENYIRSEFQRQCGDIRFGKNPLKISVVANFKPSQELAKNELYTMCGCIKKKDVDNILKIVMDGLQFCMDDDKQIVESHILKRWSESGDEYIEVAIETHDDFMTEDVIRLKKRLSSKMKSLDSKMELLKARKSLHKNNKTLEGEIDKLEKEIESILNEIKEIKNNG